MIELEVQDYGTPWMGEPGDMFECEGTLHVLVKHCTSGMCDGGGAAYHIESFIFCDGNQKPLLFKGIVRRDKIRRVKDLSMEVICV